MPAGTNKEEYNEYMRVYMGKRYIRRRNEAIQKLGGYCWECYSTENLEIDHIDRDEKSFDVGKALPGWSSERIATELLKCQILCHECHQFKSTVEVGNTPTKNRDIHGTLTSYRWCKCPVCRKFKSGYSKEHFKPIYREIKNSKRRASNLTVK